MLIPASGATARSVAGVLTAPVAVRPRTVAVFRALQLGDMLCAIPAIRALRAGLPQAAITLVGLPWASQLVERFGHYVDDFIAFPGWPGLPESVPNQSAIEHFLSTVRKRRFDLAIQLHGDGRITNDVVAAFEARHVAGFIPAGSTPSTDDLIPYPEGRPEVARLLALPAHLGFDARSADLEFPLLGEDYADLRRAMAGLPELHNYAIVHPGARGTTRRWAPRNFAAVADALAENGLTVVLTGTEEEQPVTAEVAARMRHLAFDLAGRTNLGALAVLVDGARVVVANDTGVSHVAAARHTASVVLFTDSDPRRWAPADATLHRVVIARRGRSVERAISHALDVTRRSRSGESAA